MQNLTIYQVARWVVRVMAHLNFFLLVLFPLLFQKTTYFATGAFFASYTLMKSNTIDADNLGWLLSLLVVIGFNWATNLWIGALAAGINSVVFLVFSVCVVLNAKIGAEGDKEPEFRGVFSTNIQLTIFVVLLLFDALHFNDDDSHKSLLLFIIGLVLPLYDELPSVRMFCIILFVVDFVLHVTTKSSGQVENFELSLLLYLVTFAIVFDIFFRLCALIR